MEVILRYLPRSSSRPTPPCARKRIKSPPLPSSRSPILCASPTPSPKSSILSSSSPPLASYFCIPPTADAGSQKTLASYLRQIDTQHLIRTLTVLLAAPDSELSDERLRRAARYVLRYLLVDNRGEGEVGNGELMEDVQILIACYGRQKGKKGNGMEVMNIPTTNSSTESFDVKNVMTPIQILQENAALFEEKEIRDMAGSGPVDEVGYAEAMIAWFGGKNGGGEGEGDGEEDVDVMEGAYKIYWPYRRPSIARYGSKTDLPTSFPSSVDDAGESEMEGEGEGHWYFKSSGQDTGKEESSSEGNVPEMDDDISSIEQELELFAMEDDLMALVLEQDGQNIEAVLQKYKQPSVADEEDDIPDMEDPTESDVHSDEEKIGVLSEDSNRPGGLKMCWDGYVKPSALFGWEMEEDEF